MKRTPSWTRRLLATPPKPPGPRLPPAAVRRLVQIDSVSTLDELNAPPGNRLEALRGDRAGQHSIRINDQWRVCFRWNTEGVYDVEIVDYH